MEYRLKRLSMESNKYQDYKLDVIYLEDCRQTREYWKKRSEFFGLRSSCYENLDDLLGKIENINNRFCKVFVSDFDLNHQVNGSEITKIIKEKFNFMGPFVMSSGFQRNLPHFDFEIRKANVIELIYKYFPQNVEYAKRKLLDSPVDSWSSNELSFALEKSWFCLPYGIQYNNGLLEEKFAREMTKKNIVKWSREYGLSIAYIDEDSVETNTKKGIWVRAFRNFETGNFFVYAHSELFDIPFKETCDEFVKIRQSLANV